MNTPRSQNSPDHGYVLFHSNMLPLHDTANFVEHLDCTIIIGDKPGLQNCFEIIKPVRPGSTLNCVPVVTRTMNSQENQPRLGAEAFSCPQCNAVAQQDWYSLFLKPENTAEVRVLTPEAVTVSTLRQGEGEGGDVEEIDHFVERLKKNDLTYQYQKYSQSLKVKVANLHISNCHNCSGFALWVSGRLVFPINVEKTPELVEEDFEEAAAILNKSPRGATALMRLCIQKLMPLLRQDGNGLNDYISSLVRKGAEVEIQQTMEVLRVLRDEPGQPTSLETQEDKEMALRFVDSLKAILERRMLKKSDES
jgi:hypothetical protein